MMAASQRSIAGIWRRAERHSLETACPSAPSTHRSTRSRRRRCRPAQDGRWVGTGSAGGDAHGRSRTATLLEADPRAYLAASHAAVT